MSTPWSQNRYCYIFTFASQKPKVLPWLFGPNTWLIRSPKVHSKSSRLAEMGKKWKGVDLQFHFLSSSFFFSSSFSLVSKSCVIRKGSFGASFPILFSISNNTGEWNTPCNVHRNIFFYFSIPRNTSWPKKWKRIACDRFSKFYGVEFVRSKFFKVLSLHVSYNVCTKYLGS